LTLFINNNEIVGVTYFGLICSALRTNSVGTIFFEMLFVE